MRKLLGGLFVVALLFSACGGGDDNKSDNASASGSSSTAVASGGGGGDASTFCGYRAAFNTPTAPSGDLKTQMDQAVAAVDKGVAAAPSEIKADVRTVGTALKAWAEELRADNYDYMKAGPKVQSIFTDDVRSAAERINAWVEAHCK
jgi:hypothetical protein